MHSAEMPDGGGFGSAWNDDDVPEIHEDVSLFDALDFSAPAAEPHSGGEPWDSPDRPDRPNQADDAVETLLVTASNPANTVSVTVLLAGDILKVELKPEVVTMTERQLAEEIRIITQLAQRRAKAAQHVLIHEQMRALGRDSAWPRSFLERHLGLPLPQDVRAETAELFGTYYAEDTD